jgi:transposase, IS30 family
MRSYRRVAYEDRCQIQAFLQVKVSKKEMARSLGFHRSTIYRELLRNRLHRRGYIAGRANKKAVLRVRGCRRPRLIQGELADFVVNRLMEGWSPEQICGRLNRERGTTLSVPTVYRFVHQHWHAFKDCLRWFNRRGGGRLRMRRYKRSIGLSIRARPEAANLRSRRGDWERDLFRVANQKQFLICTDRKSRYTKLAKAPVFTAKNIASLTGVLLQTTKTKVHTITNDNGTEFKDVSSLKIPIYFCDPRRPQQRGTVENTIGLIRHYIKRTDSFDQISTHYLQEIEDRLNLRPRKCLDFKTPHEVFYRKSVALAS